MSEPFVGEIRMVGFNFAPAGWAFCQGQLLPIAQYSPLFSLLGTMYGGNGTTTFGLPDLRGRSPVGMGNAPGLMSIIQGEMAGNENVTLVSTQMPMHTHAAMATAAFAVAGTPSNASATPSATNNVLGASQTGGPPSAAIWSDALNNPVALGNTETVNVTVQPAGGSLPVPLRNPFLGTNFIIALEGIYPSRP
jgi:microcystin-dependent protein